MKILLNSIIVSVLSLFFVSSVFAAPATRVSGALWANDELFDTVLTDTSFHLPPVQSTDVLYNFMMSGLRGQRSVSESGPGDRNFNGGRWSVKLVTFTDAGKAVHDPDGDGIVNFELTNSDDVLTHQNLGHIAIMDTSIYCECPLLKRKNSQRQ